MAQTRILSLLFSTSLPLFATTIPFNSIDWTGVGLLSINGSPVCSAVAIGSQALLTAAHCVGSSQNAGAVFRQGSGGSTVSVTSSSVVVHPTYQGGSTGADLAIILLDQALPSWVATYGLYALNDELGQGFSGAGYAGASLSGFHAYQNQFDAQNLNWNPDWLFFDYDSGLAQNNALAAFGPSSLGGPNEGLIVPGDSGGPALINGLIAGLAHGIYRYEYLADGQLVSADVDGVTNSSMGEIGVIMRVSPYRTWILSNIGGTAEVTETVGAETPEPGTLALAAAGLALVARRALSRCAARPESTPAARPTPPGRPA